MVGAGRHRHDCRGVHPGAADRAHRSAESRPGVLPQAAQPGHPLGTDSAGRDVLSRLIYAGQVSLTVGLVAALMSTTIGLVLGSLAGTYRGWVDTLIMRADRRGAVVPRARRHSHGRGAGRAEHPDHHPGHRPVLLADLVPHRAQPGAFAARAGLLPRRARARRNPTHR